jgi:plastocyanin
MRHTWAILPAVRSGSLSIVFSCFAALEATAGTLEITVKDARGAAVEDAVAWAMPRGGPGPARRQGAAVEQRDKAFIPLVSVIQAGTPVSFPNRDPIRHHVYSFSPAKAFEIKLYAGTPAAPIVFDKAGEVVLGCNIHDHMLAYVYVVDTPWFGKSGKDGVVRIEGVGAGDYELNLWHYALASPAAAQPLKVRGDETVAAGFAVALKPMLPRPAPK